MATVTLRIDGRFKKQLRATIGRYTADAGFLEDKPHKKPITRQGARKAAWKKAGSKVVSPRAAVNLGTYKTYAGGPARRTGRGTNGTIQSVSEDLRRRTGINIFTAPFKTPKNKELVRFANKFLQRLFRPSKISQRQVENLLTAIVRNPIVRGDYGRNSRATVKIKGFNRFMIDTAQMVRNIKGRLNRRGR